MALSGVHIVCGRVATRAGATLMIYPDWSETLASPGTTTNKAVDGNSILQVSAATDAFFAVGANPNATTGARYFVLGGTTREVFCTNGDKVAWVAA